MITTSCLYQNIFFWGGVPGTQPHRASLESVLTWHAGEAESAEFHE